LRENRNQLTDRNGLSSGIVASDVPNAHSWPRPPLLGYNFRIVVFWVMTQCSLVSHYFFYVGNRLPNYTRIITENIII
jgi:hypothetical protein